MTTPRRPEAARVDEPVGPPPHEPPVLRERAWPDLPAAGELIRFPIGCPPIFAEAVGYTGPARWVGVYLIGGPDGEVRIADGAVDARMGWPILRVGWTPAWRLLTVEHPLGAALLAPYDLVDPDLRPDRRAPHWLLIDRWERTLHVGRRDDVARLLAAQPSAHAFHDTRLPDEPLADEIYPDSVKAGPGHRDWRRRSRRSALLSGELGVWLDREQARHSGLAGGERP